jgi:hypothetical protein
VNQEIEGERRERETEREGERREDGSLHDKDFLRFDNNSSANWTERTRTKALNTFGASEKMEAGDKKMATRLF